MNNKQLHSGIQALVKGRGEMGQIQVLAIFLFLLLIPTTAIIAQNSSIQTNFSGEITGETASNVPNQTQTKVADGITGSASEDNQSQTIDTTGQTADTITDIIIEENVSNISQETNQTVNETIPTEPATNYTNETETYYNETVSDEINQTNETIINQTVIKQTTINETTNETEPIPPETNQTLNETLNETAGTPLPVLDVGILSPDGVTRGLSIQLKAYVKNIGFGIAKDVEIEWILPDGFVVLTGSGRIYCQEVAPETSCWNNITAAASLSSHTGLNDVRIMVRYAEQ